MTKRVHSICIIYLQLPCDPIETKEYKVIGNGILIKQHELPYWEESGWIREDNLIFFTIFKVSATNF